MMCSTSTKPYFLLSIAALLHCLSAAHAATWPTIPMPPNVNAFTAGEQFTSNGMAMRVQGFLSKDQSVIYLADWFRRSLGQPLVEDRKGDKLILGRAQNGYYLSVQLEPTSGGSPERPGSKGLMAVSDIKSANENLAHYSSSNQRWLQRWPSGSQLVSHMSSEENGKAASHVVIVNSHSESFNRDALVDMLRQDGYMLERESTADNKMADRLPAHLRESKTLFFRGDAKEAIATIARDTQGRTAMVLNTTIALETYKK